MIAKRVKDGDHKDQVDPRVKRFDILRTKLRQGEELTQDERDAYPDLERFIRDR